MYGSSHLVKTRFCWSCLSPTTMTLRLSSLTTDTVQNQPKLFDPTRWIKIFQCDNVMLTNPELWSLNATMMMITDLSKDWSHTGHWSQVSALANTQPCHGKLLPHIANNDNYDQFINTTQSLQSTIPAQNIWRVLFLNCQLNKDCTLLSLWWCVLCAWSCGPGSTSSHHHDPASSQHWFSQIPANTRYDIISQTMFGRYFNNWGQCFKLLCHQDESYY